MAPTTNSGARLRCCRFRERPSVYSCMGYPKGSLAAKSLAMSDAMDRYANVDTFRSRFLLLLVVAALVALAPGSGWGAEDSAAPAASSATSEPAVSPPSGLPSARDSSAGALPAPPAAPPPPADPTSIVEWLNQTVGLHDTAEALDRPSSDGKAVGRIRAGAEVKAIGIVSGRHWVQIQLPDQRLAYIPSGAIELNDNSAERPPGKGPQPAAATQPSATSPEAPSTPAVVRGPVTRVPNAATLVVADQRVRLSGIDPGPPTALAPFENWVRVQGALQCEPDAQTGRYRCFTSSGVDVAEAAILNGAGRVGDGATPGYRERETEARQGRRGLWQGP
jgi:endonuclease YncB( thermonuclease family)